MTPLNRRFRSLFHKAEQDRHNDQPSIYTKAAATAEALLADPHDVCVLHGDIHHENIRYNTHRGWLAFDPKGLIGERTYDAANTLYNPYNPAEVRAFAQNETRLLNTAKILAQKLDIELTRLLAFAFVYGCLSASWSLEDGQEADRALSIAHSCDVFQSVL